MFGGLFTLAVLLLVPAWVWWVVKPEKPVVEDDDLAIPAPPAPAAIETKRKPKK